MYNSILVNMLAKLWNLVEQSYENSFLKKIVDQIKRLFTFLFKGSIIKSLISDEKEYIDNSFLYKIYKWLINLYNIVINKLNKFFCNQKDGSVFCKFAEKYLTDDKTSINTLISTLRFLFLGMLIINIFVNKNIYVSLALIIMVITLSSKFIEYFKTSLIYKFCEYMFAVDEGGDQWW